MGYLRIVRSLQWVIALSTLCVIGCKGNGDPDEYQEPTPAPNQGAPVDLTGTFASRFVMSQYVESPLSAGGEEQQSIETFGMITLTPMLDSPTVLMSKRTCLVSMTEVSGSQASLDPGYYSEPDPGVAYAEVPSATVGGTFSVQDMVDLQGIRLEDPLNDPLPTDANDTRIYDYDGDTFDGYTVKIEGILDGWLHSIGRSVMSMDGTIVTEDFITGLTQPFSETINLESSNPLIPLDTNYYVDDVPERNFFEMVRLSEDYSCSRLLEERTQLFPE